MIWSFVSVLLFHLSALADLPEQPQDVNHPGSATYEYQFKHEVFSSERRNIDVFLPVTSQARKVPVIVFGHGQAIDFEGYRLTFEHLAKKGVAVIHPTYDTGFFDQDWRRMSRDFNQLTKAALVKYEDVIDSEKIVYSGHSKGAYIALMAAGDTNLKNLGIRAGAVVLFAPAGYDQQYIKTLDPSIPITIVWSDKDTVIKQNLITEIYGKLPSLYKQWILAKSYKSLEADHFFPLSKSYFFGGRDGVSAYHYYAVWKWLLGAVWDLQSDGGSVQNSFLYGDQTATTGVADLEHLVTRSW